MLKELWSSVRVLWDNGAETVKNAEHIRNVQDELSQLAEFVQILALRDAQRELQHQSELHAKELELLELRLRLELSEKLRQLPPSKPE